MDSHLHQSLVASKTANNIKTIFIMVVFVAIIAVVGIFVSQYTGNMTFLWGLILGSVAMNLYSYYFSDKLALSSAKAVPADPQKYAELHSIIRDLSSKANIKTPGIYIINDPAPNAFATGRNANHASVAVTTGLLATMNKGELEGVLAHEISHITNKDILIMTIIVVLAGVLTYLAQFAFSIVGNRGRDDNQSHIFALLLGLGASILIPLAVGVVKSTVSRKREYNADATGALLSGYSEGLASALEKIGRYSQGMKTASVATAHLYISNPFGPDGAMQSFMQKLFMTHPPIEDRVKALRGKRS